MRGRKKRDMVVITFKMERYEYECLKEFAEITNNAISEIIRNAIHEYTSKQRYYPCVSRKVKVYIPKDMATQKNFLLNI